MRGVRVACPLPGYQGLWGGIPENLTFFYHKMSNFNWPTGLLGSKSRQRKLGSEASWKYRGFKAILAQNRPKMLVFENSWGGGHALPPLFFLWRGRSPPFPPRDAHDWFHRGLKRIHDLFLIVLSRIGRGDGIWDDGRGRHRTDDRISRCYDIVIRMVYLLYTLWFHWAKANTQLVPHHTVLDWQGGRHMRRWKGRHGNGRGRHRILKRIHYLFLIVLSWIGRGGRHMRRWKGRHGNGRGRHRILKRIHNLFLIILSWISRGDGTWDDGRGRHQNGRGRHRILKRIHHLFLIILSWISRGDGIWDDGRGGTGMEGGGTGF